MECWEGTETYAGIQTAMFISSQDHISTHFKKARIHLFSYISFSLLKSLYLSRLTQKKLLHESTYPPILKSAGNRNKGLNTLIPAFKELTIYNGV